MKYGGIEFDLSYAPIARYPFRLPMVIIVLNTFYIGFRYFG